MKTSTERQREHRKRKREQGLQKVEFWVKPENIQQFKELEKRLSHGV